MVVSVEFFQGKYYKIEDFEELEKAVSADIRKIHDNPGWSVLDKVEYIDYIDFEVKRHPMFGDYFESLVYNPDNNTTWITHTIRGDLEVRKRLPQIPKKKPKRKNAKTEFFF